MRSLCNILLLLLVAAGCGRQENQKDPDLRPRDTFIILEKDPRDTLQAEKKEPEPEPKKTPKPVKETPKEPVADKPPQGGIGYITALRTSSTASHERIVIEFSGNDMPEWWVEYVDKPVYQCGSGEAEWLPGDAWLKIDLEAAQAHNEEGRSTVGPRIQKFDYQNLKEIRITCDFEAQVSFVAGLEYPGKIKVFKLKDPLRLVIDIKNPQLSQEQVPEEPSTP